MNAVKQMSTLKKDYLASCLRSQLATLQSILTNIEDSNECDEVYVKGSLRRLERELHRLQRANSN